MPTYVVTAPDGKEYEITAPEGATQEQVLKYAQENFPKASPAPSTGSQILRQLGLTARAGITGAATIPAMLAEPFAAAAGVPDQMGRLQGALTRLGLPEPSGALERAVQAGAGAVAGVPATAALSGGSKLLEPLRQNIGTQMAVAGPAGTVSQAAAEQVTETTESPTAGLIAGFLAGTAAGKTAAKGVSAATDTRAPSLTLDQIKKRSQDQYTVMQQQGVAVKPKSVLDAFDGIEANMRKAGFDPEIVDTHKPVYQQLESFRKAVGTQRVDFDRLEKMRGQLSDLRSSNDTTTRRYAGKAVAELDSYIASLGPKDILSNKGSLDAAVKAVANARQDWRNMSKASILEDALNTAEAKALDPKASEGELLRRQLINLAADKNKIRQFSTAEQAAIRKAATGGTLDPLLSLAARFNPERSQLVAAGTFGAGITNPALGIGIGAGGFAADRALGAMRRRAAETLIRDVASGNLKPEEVSMAYRAMMSSIQPQE
jgi:hypothetical protein